MPRATPPSSRSEARRRSRTRDWPASDPYDRLVLIGRDAEQARLEVVLGEARAGRAGVLVVRGEPGVGKTTLLAAAIERATDFSVLRSTGVQSERRELPFAGLHALLKPVLGEIERLPEPQLAALRSALALGPSAAGDAFATHF